MSNAGRKLDVTNTMNEKYINYKNGFYNLNYNKTGSDSDNPYIRGIINNIENVYKHPYTDMISNLCGELSYSLRKVNNGFLVVNDFVVGKQIDWDKTFDNFKNETVINSHYLSPANTEVNTITLAQRSQLQNQNKVNPFSGKVNIMHHSTLPDSYLKNKNIKKHSTDIILDSNGYGTSKCPYIPYCYIIDPIKGYLYVNNLVTYDLFRPYHCSQMNSSSIGICFWGSFHVFTSDSLTGLQDKLRDDYYKLWTFSSGVLSSYNIPMFYEDNVDKKATKEPKTRYIIDCFITYMLTCLLYKSSTFSFHTNYTKTECPGILIYYFIKWLYDHNILTSLEKSSKIVEWFGGSKPNFKIRINPSSQSLRGYINRESGFKDTCEDNNFESYVKKTLVKMTSDSFVNTYITFQTDNREDKDNTQTEEFENNYEIPGLNSATNTIAQLNRDLYTKKMTGGLQ